MLTHKYLCWHNKEYFKTYVLNTCMSTVEPSLVGRVPLVHPVQFVPHFPIPGGDMASMVPAGGRNLRIKKNIINIRINAIVLLVIDSISI